MIRRPALLALLAATALAATPAAAPAKGGDGVRVTGSCSKGATSKLKVKSRDGRLEIEFEVDQNRSGVRWNVLMAVGRTTIASTRATTKRPSGSFTVRRTVADRAGRDQVSARATSPSGQTCSARASI
jgi:hypothetical protein